MSEALQNSALREKPVVALFIDLDQCTDKTEGLWKMLEERESPLPQWGACFGSRTENEGDMAEEGAAALVRGSPPAGGEGLSADAFRGLAMAFQDARVQRATDVETAAVIQRRDRIKALIDQHISDTRWQELLHQARQVAERGEKEYLLLRFPSELCTDGARAINNPPNPDWPKTLQGEAMELYARWRDQLSPRGFQLAARVLDFPGGKPGDVGLFLFWGE